MTRYLLLVLGVGLGLGAWKPWTDWREHARFAAWRVDHERRSWSLGDVNLPCISFPVNKQRNETAWRNTRDLKRTRA